MERSGGAKDQRPQQKPLVSVLIPTAGSRRSIRGRPKVLVHNCIRSLMQRSRYRHLEVVIIDGGECSDELIEELQTMVGEGLGRDVGSSCATAGPTATHPGSTEPLKRPVGNCCCNSTTTPKCWIQALEALIEALEGPDVGIAGALLLYPDGKVQHAGTAIDNLAPRHAWAGCLPAALPWGTLQGHRTFHAVTAAVSLCRRTPLGAAGRMFRPLPGQLWRCGFLPEGGGSWLANGAGAPKSLDPLRVGQPPTDGVPPELGSFEERWAQRLGGKYSVDEYCSAWRRLLCDPRTD